VPSCYRELFCACPRRRPDCAFQSGILVFARIVHLYKGGLASQYLDLPQHHESPHHDQGFCHVVPSGYREGACDRGDLLVNLPFRAFCISQAQFVSRKSCPMGIAVFNPAIQSSPSPVFCRVGWRQSLLTYLNIYIANPPLTANPSHRALLLSQAQFLGRKSCPMGIAVFNPAIQSSPAPVFWRVGWRQSLLTYLNIYISNPP